MDTFVIRMWRGGDAHATARGAPDPDSGIRGVLRHVGSGSESAFAGPDELLRLLGGPVALGGSDRPTALGPETSGRAGSVEASSGR